MHENIAEKLSGACRNSKLTMLLQDSLGGNAKALMIANLAPAPAHASETLSSLAFASKVLLWAQAAALKVQYLPLRHLRLACRSVHI